MAPTICCTRFFSSGDARGDVSGVSGTCDSLPYVRGGIGNGEGCGVVGAGCFCIFLGFY